jgi:menaquinone-specific isochorismate synthase
MITLFRANTTRALPELKGLMAAHIRRLAVQIAPVGTPLKVLRFELPCEPVDILAWLHNQHAGTKVYWSDREGRFEMGGVGAADSVKRDGALDYGELLTYIEDRLSADNPRLRYYGGMGFYPSSDVRDWQDFGTGQFIVPRFEFFQSREQTVFAFNIACQDVQEEKTAEILKTLDELSFAADTVYRGAPKVTARNDCPDREAWGAIFSRLISPTGRREFEKIVLARKSVFDFDVDIRPDALVKHLKDRTPRCFHFCLQPRAGSAFLGATPERLYKREGRHLESEAMAGTRPRGKDEQEDLKLESQLLNSAKEAREHKFVVDAVRRALEGLCRSSGVDADRTLRKLKGSQHLVTPFTGRLHEGVGDAQILTALHPTPAVAGFPAGRAARAIGELEPFNRGWYTGPVGYIGHDTTEFAVAIRCGLVERDRLALYAGAGIVDGSTAQGEWEEIEGKIGNFIDVFHPE